MPVSVRIPDGLCDHIDAQRGDVPRERWIRRALEAAVDLPAIPSGDDPQRAENEAAEGRSIVENDAIQAEHREPERFSVRQAFESPPQGSEGATG